MEGVKQINVKYCLIHLIQCALGSTAFHRSGLSSEGTRPEVQGHNRVFIMTKIFFENGMKLDFHDNK